MERVEAEVEEGANWRQVGLTRRHLAWSPGGPGGRALLQRCTGNPEALCPDDFQYCDLVSGFCASKPLIKCCVLHM